MMQAHNSLLENYQFIYILDIATLFRVVYNREQ